MVKFLLLVCIFMVLNQCLVIGGAVFSENNAIETECKEMGSPRCVFAHVWLIGGKGDKCIVDFNAAEESTCTVKCSSITARIRCNMENDKCEWIEPKLVDGQPEIKKGKEDDGFCKRKTEIKSFLMPIITPPEVIVASGMTVPQPPIVVQPDLADLQQQQMMQQQMLMQQQMNGMAMVG